MTARPAGVLLALVMATALAAGCTDGADPAPSAAPSGDAPSTPGTPSGTAPDASSAPASATPSATPAPSGSATRSPAVADTAARALPPFTDPSRGATAQPSGGPLTVVAVRAARHAGYDRVVLELAGRRPGRPGWQVRYVEEARQQGSGDLVPVRGDAVLEVLVSGIGYPFDTGQEEESDDLRPAGTAVVREVVLGATFEGQYEAFVGVSRRVPFRVFRLSDPTRVVIDLAHR